MGALSLSVHSAQCTLNEQNNVKPKLSIIEESHELILYLLNPDSILSILERQLTLGAEEST